MKSSRARVRARARRRRSRAIWLRRRLARAAASFQSRESAFRRVALAIALLVVVLIPLPVLASDTPQQPDACAGSDCHAQPVITQRWSVRLAAQPSATASLAWAAGTGPAMTGDGGTVPANGQAAYVAVGSGAVVVGVGLTVTSYDLDRGSESWQTTLTAPGGTVITSVRAWPGVITAGLLAPGGGSRTEVVLDAATGSEVRRYPAAVFGGAVSASSATTVVIGAASVTSYANATGRVRWRRPAAGGQPWHADGQTLYLAPAKGQAQGPSPVTALQAINLKTGAQRLLSSPLGEPFPGTLAMAANGAVLFASPDGVAAYNEATGGALWTRKGWVPEGADHAAGQADFTTANGALVSVDPFTGKVRASLPASATGGAAVYVVRDGIALGLVGGANGTAWGYDMARGRTAWTTPGLPWPHFFSDLSGLGGSAATVGDTVVVTTCLRLGPSPGICADPRLVALNIGPAPAAGQLAPG